MSLLLCFSNEKFGCMTSDGLSYDNQGIVATNRKKFFRTAGGSIIGSCGFVLLSDELEARFRDSAADFKTLVEQTSEFVRDANRRHMRNSLSRPLGAVVLGIDAGEVHSANLLSDGSVNFSGPGRNFHFCCALDESDLTLKKIGQGALCFADPSDVPGFLRESVKHISEKFPDRIGGEIFEDSIMADEAGAAAGFNSQYSLVAAGGQSPFTFAGTVGGAMYVYWPTLTIYFRDGSTKSIPAMIPASDLIFTTGTPASTTIYFSLFYATVSYESINPSVYFFYSVGTPVDNQNIMKTLGDGSIPLALNVPVTTPASGNFSSSGGGLSGGYGLS